MKKFSLEEVRNEFLNHNLIPMFNIYNNANEKLLALTQDGYKVKITLHRVKQKQIPEIFYTDNPYTIENIKLWLKLNDKDNVIKLISEQYNGNNKPLQWQCLKDDCREIFEMNWSEIHNGSNCPFCAGQKVGLSNCLATKRPQLAAEWHPTLNGDLTPWDVTCGSNKYIWWLCKDCNNEWKTMVNNRNKGKGCPKHKGEKISITQSTPPNNYNLLTEHPDICKEWNYDKNDKKPEEYYPNANKDVWWKCLKCGNEWFVSINSRISLNTSCPKCNQSKGENRIENYFINNNINFNKQYRFNDCKNKYPLPFDFYLSNYNICIEYDGEFHYIVNNYFGGQEKLKQTQKRDLIKDQYCLDNNIKLIRIPYWDYNNIEQILDKELKDIKKIT